MNSTDEPAGELVLAAIDRALRHQATRDPAAFVWTVFEHLETPRRGRRARHLRDQLEQLRDAGWVAETRLRGAQMWALTRTGTRRLQTARRHGTLPELPESPQHRSWRVAHAASKRRINGFKRDLRQLIRAALELLKAEHARSDDWFDLGERLQRACWLVASATHCRDEWCEPTDATPDHDDHREPTDSTLDTADQARLMVRRRGRRDTNRWPI